MNYTYHILHIPSGHRHIGTFNTSQSPLFAPGEWQYRSAKAMEAEKMRLINEWNRQQPTEWKYWL